MRELAVTDNMLLLTGGETFSGFRLARLQQALQASGFAGQLFSVSNLYLANYDAQPTPAQQQALLELIPDALATGLPEHGTAVRLLVVPRIGTVSPWSSKATDIARVCGLQGLQRVERGRLLVLDAMPASAALELLHDRMTESILLDESGFDQVFAKPAARPLRTVPLLEKGEQALHEANAEWGLALSEEEVTYLATHFRKAQRNPSDAELMMFAQINSEHCRHKIFNAEWHIDGELQPHSLFDMIRMTHAAAPEGVLSAYSDNSAVIAGAETTRFHVDAGRRWTAFREAAPILMKVETHNHPTAISPHPGAATGSGGEIRDEAATGRGGRAKAGLCGFSVSNLNIPGATQAWEQDYGRPAHIASALQIMLEGPIGAAAFNNEFGRPNLTGFFRSFELQHQGEMRGYHKPVMIAGGMGNLRPAHVEKLPVENEALLVALGGPAMLIGLGGGAASSMVGGEGREELDFASVQRANPEMQRRCQEVIDACRALPESNPILSIHDVGAGGLSNAFPELVDADGLGARFDLAAIPKADPSMSPMELWSNESQERYVLAIREADMPQFEAIAQRERCPFAVVGRATAEPQLVLADEQTSAVDMPMAVLLGKAPRMLRDVQRRVASPEDWDTRGIRFSEAVQRVLRLPGVAAKGFLISIGDRSIGGLTCRDQLVGPWQTPVADVAVTASGFEGYTGEAMAMGERSPLALLNGPASGRMAVTEAVTNIAAASIEKLSDVRLSANWMAPAGHPGEDAVLYDTVRAVGAEFCTQLGIAIPVGKDSMSMRMAWREGDQERAVTAPLSLVCSAFAPVDDVRRTLTPLLDMSQDSELLLIDLGEGRNRLGGSSLAQVFGRLGTQVPDIENPALIAAFFAEIQALRSEGKLLAYHDRSDGGLFVTLCEMAFTSHCGLQIDLGTVTNPLAAAFAEEAGAVIQVRSVESAAILKRLADRGLTASIVARPVREGRISLSASGGMLFMAGRVELQRAWSETSFLLQQLRDEPGCAQQEYDQLLDEQDPGLSAHCTFSVAPAVLTGARPRVAVLREQGVNGQHEMAWAFHKAGFEAVDVHMSEILSGDVSLEAFRALVACGGFSYGDVLGAGRGWAQSILLNSRARDAFSAFFADPGTLSLGVCNGCQMMSSLRELIPGAEHWPRFERNRSEQFEARFSLVEVTDSDSALLAGMAGSRLPIAVAHGEGRAVFEGGQNAADVALRYVDHYGRPTETYPANPNGSPDGITGLTAAQGRVTIMMPHPERVTRSVCNSWHPEDWGEDAPWMQMFHNARRWVD